VTTVLLELKPSQIKPHKTNVRRSIGDVDELAASITEKGLLEPLIVAPDDAIYLDADGTGSGSFTLIAGHRRLAAGKKAKLKTLPCIVRADLAQDPKGQIEMMLVENLQRTDLSAVEEAEAYQLLLTFPGYTQARIAEKTGRAIATVRSRLKLAGLPKSALAKIHAGQIPLMHADAILAVKDEAAVKRLVAVAGTEQFPRVHQEIQRRLKAQAAADRLTKKLEGQGVPLIERPVYGGETRYLYGKAIEEHRDCPAFAAYISKNDYSGTATAEYVCTKPALHDKAEDGAAVAAGVDEQLEAQHEALKGATAVRRAWLRDHVLADPNEGVALDVARQMVHAKIGGEIWSTTVKELVAELLTVGLEDKKARAAAIDKLDLRQCVVLLDLVSYADGERSLSSPSGWADKGGTAKTWRARLTGVYGYTWSETEQQVLDARAAEREAERARQDTGADDMVEGATGTGITRDRAEEHAGWHRGEFGDDVVQHDAEDYGDSFRCPDCDWLVLYVPDDVDLVGE
jgi:ParB family chromosome partitioning protein